MRFGLGTTINIVLFILFVGTLILALALFAWFAVIGPGWATDAGVVAAPSPTARLLLMVLFVPAVVLGTFLVLRLRKSTTLFEKILMWVVILGLAFILVSFVGELLNLFFPKRQLEYPIQTLTPEECKKHGFDC